jgi:membrane-associated phospholipid phosphatase
LRTTGSVGPVRWPPRIDRPALPPALRLPIGVIAVLAGVVVVVLAVFYAGDTVAGPADRGIRNMILAVFPEPERAALVIDRFGAPLTVLVLAGALAVVCSALGRHRLAVVAVAGPGLTGAVTTGLKPLVARTIHEGFLAYPSGHTGAVTALALVAMLLVVDALGTGPLTGTLLVVGGAAAAGGTMSVAQIALYAHYATDTLGGFCAAVAVVPAAALLADTVAPPHRRPASSDRP